MKLTPAIAIARKLAGYRPPIEDKMVCKNCGAVRHATNFFIRWKCARHGFYVHSHGCCMSWDDKPYNPPPAPEPPKPKFIQEEMFK